MHLNIRRQGIFVIDKSVYIIQLDKTIYISLETVSSCSVINTYEFVYTDMMKFLNEVYHPIRTLK